MLRRLLDQTSGVVVVHKLPGLPVPEVHTSPVAYTPAPVPCVVPCRSLAPFDVADELQLAEELRPAEQPEDQLMTAPQSCSARRCVYEDVLLPEEQCR